MRWPNAIAFPFTTPASPQHIALLTSEPVAQGFPGVKKSARQISPHLTLCVSRDLPNTHSKCCASAANSALQMSAKDFSSVTTASPSRHFMVIRHVRRKPSVRVARDHLFRVAALPEEPHEIDREADRHAKQQS